MSTARYSLAALVFDGKLYTMGGMTGNTMGGTPFGQNLRPSSFERYDLARNEWVTVPSTDCAQDTDHSDRSNLHLHLIHVNKHTL